MSGTCSVCVCVLECMSVQTGVAEGGLGQPDSPSSGSQQFEKRNFLVQNEGLKTSRTVKMVLLAVGEKKKQEGPLQ